MAAKNTTDEKAKDLFPARAFLQCFDGRLAADAQRLSDELASRGIEVVQKHTEDILAQPLPLTREDLVVGDFDWTRRALQQLGVAMPDPPDYPAVLEKFLHRRVWRSTLGEAARAVEELAPGAPMLFIKPAADTKIFSAIIEPKEGMIGMLLEGLPGVVQQLPASLPVHCAEVIEMVSEYRVYVVRGEIRCVAHYLGPNDGKLDLEVVREAVRLMAESKDRADDIAGCGMDFAVFKRAGPDGKEEVGTCLVEVNDGYSLGVYDGLEATDHADLLIARWGQLVAGE
jgi:ATP-grasp domain, R2K clade family 2